MRCLGGVTSALLGLFLALTAPAGTVDSNGAKSPRDHYNEGTARFREGKLREAEYALQTAVASNHERVQPRALYNLGHVRFQQGAEALKESMKAEAAKARSDAASATADQAIAAADAALASGEVEAITRAYLQGRGARRELKAALAAVKKAMEAHAAVLLRWQRASGDFKSAHELQPALDDARHNAEVVNRHIAALVDKQEMMRQCMQCLGGKRQQLKEKMDQCKKKMPDGALKQDEGDEEEDEEDEDQQPKEPKPGQREQEQRDGKQMALTWEEAMRLLESLKLDSNRKLPMGDRELANPKDRKGRDW